VWDSLKANPEAGLPIVAMASLGWSPTSGNERQAGRGMRMTHVNFQRG